ncbi:MAG: GAF domain-containing protein, partial [Chloroflexota bacterium]
MATGTQEHLKFENAFQQLLINLATRFINQPVEQMDEAITDALRQIAGFLGSIRSSINQLDDELAYYKPLYVWPPFESDRILQDRVPIPELGFYTSYLNTGEAVKISNRYDLPESDPFRQFLANLNACAIVVVPILRQGKVMGFISTTWSKPQGIQAEIVGLLQVVGEIFVNAMDRRDNEARISKLTEDLTERVEERTQELVSVNKQLQNQVEERERVGKALRESEERYRIVTEVISDYAFLYAVEPDNTLKLEWITSESYERLSGYSVSQGLQPSSAYSIEYERLAREDVQRTIEGHITEREYRVLTKSGEMRWIYMRRFPIWDAEHKRVVRFYGVAQEITARKKVEEALRLSEERYRIVTGVITDYAFLCTVDENQTVKIEWITEDSFSRLTGYPKGVWGEPFMLYHPEDVQLAREDTTRTLMGEITQSEYRIMTLSGAIRWVNLRRYPVWDGQHERIIQFYGVAQDITERKQIEATEREQRKMTEALLDIADALNSTLDLEEVLDRILANLERVAPRNIGSIFLIESDVARVVRVSKSNIPGWEKATENFQFRLENAPNLLWVYKTGQPLIIPDVKDNANWIDVPASRWIRCHVCIPIKQDEQVIGFLTWDNAMPNSFNPSMLSGLQAFAHQTAIAITNAKLYQQGQALAVLEDRQRLARDLHDAVTQTLFSANMIAEMLPRQWENDPEQARRGLNQMHYLTRGALAEMRLLLMELRPEALEGVSLARLVTQLSEAFT